MRRYAVLRLARAVAAALFLVELTACFAGAAWAAEAFGWTARVQFVPALLAGGCAAAALAAATFVFGRLYCSVVCPLGVAQDAVIFLRNRISGKAARRRGAVRPGRAAAAVRWCAAAVFFAGGFAGLHFAWLDPYGIYGRAAALLAPGVERAWPAAVCAVAPAVAILVLAALKGRVWCNIVCPVGTLLGCAARVAVLRPRIDRSKCVKCGMCERACGARCIDVSGGGEAIDRTRCVSCFACGAVCRKGAVSWTK